MCLSLTAASCTPRVEYVGTEFVYPLEDEARQINTVADPSGTYTVVRGDTPRSAAAKLGVDFDLFARTNGITAESRLEPGTLLVVPRIGTAKEPYAAARTPYRPAVETSPPPPVAPKPPEVLVDASGAVRAASAGTVSGVFRDYPSLGDVVIIENDREKAVYSGRFEPRVLKGARVSAGDVIAGGADRASVKVRFFLKGE